MLLTKIDKKLEREIEEAWVEVLARIYLSVNWSQVARNQYPDDIFQHRIRFASTMPDVASVLGKLCNLLSLQAPPIPLDKVNFLREYENIAISMLRKWSMLLTKESTNKAREIRKKLKENKNE